MRYIDAISHIASLPDLIGFMASNAPDKLDASGRITGFDTATMVASGVAGLVYVRMAAADAETFRVTPGVTILAEAPYGGIHTADAVYAILADNPAAGALYEAIWPRTPISIDDGVGGTGS